MFVAPAFAQDPEPEVEAPVVQAEEPVLNTEVGIETDRPEGSFPPFDSTFYASQLLWLAITFGLFYWFLKNVILPRIGGILEVRSDRIAQDLDQAARLKAEADAEMAAFEQELAEARASANAIGQKARDEAKAEADAERRQVEAALESRLAEAENRIALVKDAAMRDVGAVAEETAAAIVRQLVGAAPDKASVQAAVRSAGG